jgi:hypothetical protein
MRLKRQAPPEYFIVQICDLFGQETGAIECISGTSMFNSFYDILQERTFTNDPKVAKGVQPYALATSTSTPKK